MKQEEIANSIVDEMSSVNLTKREEEEEKEEN